MGIYDFFRRSETRYPDRVALVSDKRSYTYREAGELTRRIGAAVAARFAPGTRVSVFSPNDVDAFACVLGILAGKGCWVPLNARNAVEENAYILGNTECEMLFVHSSLAQYVPAFRKAVPGLREVVGIDQPIDGGPSLADFIADADPDSLTDEPDDPERIVTLLSTGGTTGRPKGVMWNTRVWETMIASFWIHQDTPQPPVHLVSAPMTHAAGVLAMALIPAGATTVILDKFDPLAVMQAIEKLYHG